MDQFNILKLDDPYTVTVKTKTSTACFSLTGSSGGNLKTTLKVKIYDTEL